MMWDQWRDAYEFVELGEARPGVWGWELVFSCGCRGRVFVDRRERLANYPIPLGRIVGVKVQAQVKILEEDCPHQAAEEPVGRHPWDTPV